MDQGFKNGVGGAGKDVGASDAEDRESTDAVESGKVPRVGASFRYRVAAGAGLHSLSMVAARYGRDGFAEERPIGTKPSWSQSIRRVLWSLSQDA